MLPNFGTSMPNDPWVKGVAVAVVMIAFIGATVVAAFDLIEHPSTTLPSTVTTIIIFVLTQAGVILTGNQQSKATLNGVAVGQQVAATSLGQAAQTAATVANTTATQANTAAMPPSSAGNS